MFCFLRPLFIALLTVALSGLSAAPAQDIRVLNIDFGNGGAFVGDSGVLSSPGGTFWNEVTVVSSSASGGLAGVFPVNSPLLDEFGASFGVAFPASGIIVEPLPSVSSSFGDVEPFAGTAAGPRNDGVTIAGGFGSLTIRELSTETPFDLAVYLNEPGEVVINAPFDAISATSVATSTPFPGVEGRDFFLFEGLTAVPTTIGSPLLPGVFIDGPDSGEPVSIAALQIRGVFTFTPEPSAATMMVVGAVVAGWLRRR